MPHEIELTNRRDFARNALQSLTTLVLIEGLWLRRLLGADVRRSSTTGSRSSTRSAATCTNIGPRTSSTSSRWSVFISG